MYNNMYMYNNCWRDQQPIFRSTLNNGNNYMHMYRGNNKKTFNITTYCQCGYCSGNIINYTLLMNNNEIKHMDYSIKKVIDNFNKNPPIIHNHK